MNIVDKHDEIKELVLGDIKGVILTPQYYSNKVDNETNYIKRLNHVFVGSHDHAENGSKYMITIFVQNFLSKAWMREELLVDAKYNLLNINFTKSI